MSPTIALICVWLMTHPQTVTVEPARDIGLTWPATTASLAWSNNYATPIYYVGYGSKPGAVCPIHGPLDHGSWSEALTFAGRDGCHTRPVCIRCLMAAIEAPGSCVPKVEVSE